MLRDSPRLNTQHLDLWQLTESLPDSFYFNRHMEGKWSIAEHTAHLGRYQEIFQARLARIRNEEKPRLKRYSADEDLLFTQWCTKKREDLEQDLNTGREELIALLDSFQPKDYRQLGIHPKFGEMSVAEWLRFFLLHESHHHYAVFRLIMMFRNS